MSTAFDHALFGEAFARPGMDPRQWVSYATVDRATPSQPSVSFGGPYGPMVNVTLQPSGISCPARCSSFVAGAAEGEWYPFVEGDEVVCLIPEGDTRGGVVIVGRCNQELDEWPTVVGGVDATQNKIGFRRMRAPYVVEVAASYLIRSVLTGAQLGISPEGNVIIADGNGGSLVLGTDALGLANEEGDAFVNLFPAAKQVYLGADTATFLLDAAESKFISQGAISFATLGGSSNGHGVTAEQVVALIANVITACAAAGWLAIVPSAAVIAPIITAAVAGLGLTTPTDSVPGGVFAPLYATVFGPTGAIGVVMSNPLVGSSDPTGFVPGFGRPGFSL